MIEPILQMRNMGWKLHGLMEGAQVGTKWPWVGIPGVRLLHCYTYYLGAPVASSVMGIIHCIVQILCTGALRTVRAQ